MVKQRRVIATVYHVRRLHADRISSAPSPAPPAAADVAPSTSSTNLNEKNVLQIQIGSTMKINNALLLNQSGSDAVEYCRRRFPLIFAFYILNVRHISTSGLIDLLT